MNPKTKTWLLGGAAVVALFGVYLYAKGQQAAADQAQADTLGAFPYFQTAALPSTLDQGTTGTALAGGSNTDTTGATDLSGLLDLVKTQFQAQSSQAAADTAAQLQEAQWNLQAAQLSTQSAFGQSIIGALTNLFTTSSKAGGENSSMLTSAGVHVGTYFQGDFSLSPNGGMFTFGAGDASNPLPFVQVPGSSQIFASTGAGPAGGLSLMPLSTYSAASAVQANNPTIVLPSNIAVPGTASAPSVILAANSRNIGYEPYSSPSIYSSAPSSVGESTGGGGGGGE